MRITSSADEHETGSRVSTQSPPSTVSQERTSQEVSGQLDGSRESRNSFLALPSAPQQYIRHSVASFNEHLMKLDEDGGTC